MRKRINKVAYRDLKFVYCDDCKEIHEPNIRCVGNLEFGELIT